MTAGTGISKPGGGPGWPLRVRCGRTCATVAPMIEPFVDRAWLTAHSSDVVLVDVRSYLDARSGHAAYEAGHLPGAIYLELAHVLSDPPGDTRRGRHPSRPP